MKKENHYPSFPKCEEEKTIENIIRQYPKTNDCEIQTLGELRDWQIAELKKLFNSKQNVKSWVAATVALPKPNQTVWLTNGLGWIALGCLVETQEGWHWAESNGYLHIENGEIIAECESADLDVVYWHELTCTKVEVSDTARFH